jgi:hypothetical protein
MHNELTEEFPVQLFRLTFCDNSVAVEKLSVHLKSFPG